MYGVNANANEWFHAFNGGSFAPVQPSQNNAWEWVSDVYRDKGLFSVRRIERGIIRGGAYSYSYHQGRASYIGFESENLTCGDLGFRCAKDAELL